VQKSIFQTQLSLVTEAQAQQLNKTVNNAPGSVALLKQAKQASVEAKANKVKAKANFEETIKQHNARLYSLSQEIDVIFRSHKIKKEHYHDGKYNGVNCIRIMDKAQQLWTEFAVAIKDKKVPMVPDTIIDAKCTQFSNLMGLMDAIWSHVQGVGTGLSPTALQVEWLQKTIEKAKALWLNMGIGTLQPKWHMTFDGHLLHQVRTYGGLADKSDETIELQHQVIKRPKDRFRSVTSYQRQETCIRKELRRGKSPEIKSHIDKDQAAIKRKSDSQRSLEMTERQQGQHEAKPVKREAFVDS